LHFLPAAFHDAIFAVMKRSIAHWFEPFQRFREEIGLDPDDDPVFKGKNSPLAHLAMFSRVLGSPQPDWPASAIQTGFCFYDARPDGLEVPAGLREFLDAGEPPIVFTLGSAAVLDAGDFFEQSARAATRLGRRAILIHSEHNERPDGIGPDIAAFDYVPYSMVFPRAACVVHQGGVGTTAQVLRAGVPHLIMPYGHDQPDNAARCRRIGVAEVINRSDYDASAAAEALARILSNSAYAENAKAAMKTIELEHGTETAGDAVERVLNNLTA
jgi:UDP:flavonoid glycosyltransferase YjiC (YdhE family)